MSVTHSAYKKTPSQRRRDSPRKHDYYVERQNNKQCTNTRTMTHNIDIKMQYVKKIKCTSQETQTEQVIKKHIPVRLCTCSKSKESDIEIVIISMSYIYLNVGTTHFYRLALYNLVLGLMTDNGHVTIIRVLLGQIIRVFLCIYYLTCIVHIVQEY